MTRRIVVRAAGLALAGSGLLFFAMPAAASPAPEGSYQQTCRDVSVTRGTLTAECKTRRGGWTSTHLDDYGDCDGDISNDNGKLSCEDGRDRSNRGSGNADNDEDDNDHRGHQQSNDDDHAGAHDADRGDNDSGDDRHLANYPQGSYRDTCRNIHTDRGDLIAECRTWDGEWHRTTLEGYAKCSHIINDKGKLRCAAGNEGGGNEGSNWQPQGSYQDSCRNIRVSRGELQAECKWRSSWKHSTLADARACRGDIANDRGRLVCAPRRGSITLFRSTRFRGDNRDYRGDTAELGPFAHRASSATVRGGSWQLCTRQNFRGRCVTIDESVSNFADIGVNNQVESIRRIK